jgi:hypothetical protein
MRVLARDVKIGLLKRRKMMLKHRLRDSLGIENNSELSGRRRDAFFTAGLCFLCVAFGVVVGTRIAISVAYAGDNVNAVSRAGEIHELPDVGGKGGRAWLEGTKGWEQSGHYLYPVEASDSVGIGVTPTAKLDVNGLVRIRGGIPGVSKVLTSDANGFASWVNPPEVIPSGVIVMWSGPLSSIPSGWALCDGTNGTPDLRDRFIYGWSDGVNPGGTGGSTSHTHEAGTYEAPAHTHTYNEVIAHTHAIDAPPTLSSSVSAGTPSGRVSAQYYSQYMAATGALDYLEDKNGGSSGSYDLMHRTSGTFPAPASYPYWIFAGDALPAHSHTTDISSFSSESTGSPSGTTELGGGGAITGTSAAADHLPPYYKLAFIMKL